MKNYEENIPQAEKYRVKYNFKNDSSIDINNIIKECFINTLRTKGIEKNTSNNLIIL